MKKYVLKMDLTIQKIQEDSDKMESNWDSLYYCLPNGFRMRIRRSSRKIEGFAVDCGGSDDITTDALAEVLEKFGIKEAQEKLKSAVHNMVETACNNPFFTINSNLFTRLHGKNPKEVAETYKLFLDINVIQKTDDFVSSYEKIMPQALVEYINSKGYKVEMSESEKPKDTTIF